jgi:hypothetical protein
MTDIHDLTDQEQLLRFRELVIDDIKSDQDKEILDYLCSNLHLWLYTLQTLRREVELQISCQNAKLKMDISNLTNSTELSSSDDYNRENEIVDLKVKHHKWKMSVLKFLTNIEIKTLYVKMLINQTNKLEMEAN